MNEYDLIIEALNNGAPEDEITSLLNEGKFDEEHRETQDFYILLFEQYMDECSTYSFEGWDEIYIYGEPRIEKFWIEIKLLAPDNIDYEGGIKRMIGTHNQNKAEIKSLNTGNKLIKLRILRSLLDEIEENNRKLARKEAEEQGYAPKEEPENEQPEDNMDDPFGDDAF